MTLFERIVDRVAALVWTTPSRMLFGDRPDAGQFYAPKAFRSTYLSSAPQFVGHVRQNIERSILLQRLAMRWALAIVMTVFATHLVGAVSVKGFQAASAKVAEWRSERAIKRIDERRAEIEKDLQPLQQSLSEKRTKLDEIEREIQKLIWNR